MGRGEGRKSVNRSGTRLGKGWRSNRAELGEWRSEGAIKLFSSADEEESPAMRRLMAGGRRGRRGGDEEEEEEEEGF